MSGKTPFGKLSEEYYSSSFDMQAARRGVLRSEQKIGDAVTYNVMLR